MIYHFFNVNKLHLSPAIIESILKNANETNKNEIKNLVFCFKK